MHRDPISNPNFPSRQRSIYYLKYYFKSACQQTEIWAQIILWCGLLGNALEPLAVAAEPPQSGDLSPAAAPSNTPVDNIKAIVNNRPAQQLNVQGELNPQQQPIDLQGWLLPFDLTLALLEIQQKQAANGELELNAPYMVVKFNRQQWRSHPRWGRAISIGDLQKLPGVKVAYNQKERAIEFSYSLPKNAPQPAADPLPVSLDGLEAIDPPKANLSAVQERINLSGSANNQLNTQGEFKAVGTVFGSSWYMRIEQPKLGNLLTWGISDAMLINQSASSDWIAGSQSPFWRRQGNDTGTYWGVTTIQRDGFTPPVSLFGGDFVPNERLQSSRMGRTVSGQAQPGTVVLLVKGFTEVIDRVLVDSSGVFRFENVIVSRDGEFGNNYRLLLYPNGQLTADPQVRDVTFTTVPGQLPVGTGAWISSAGVNYNRGSNQFIGNFDRPQGGIAYRRGASESLTVGGGIIADPAAVRGLGELFWQPTGVPLKASISAVSGDRWDVVSSLNYQPASNFTANFSSDKFSSRGDLNWLITPKFTAIGRYDSISGLAIGGNYNFSVAPGSYSNIQGTFDSKSFLRWSASHLQNNWQVGLQGNEISLNSEVSYRLPTSTGTSHSIVANYQTTNALPPLASTNLGQLLWRYQSPAIQSELGYGWSGFGQGINASIGANLTPGLKLVGRYQGISAFTNQQNFSLEVQSTIDLQGGSQTSTRVEDLRTRGGIAIRPFFDRNGNGKPDPGEESYWHPQLVTLDRKALNPAQISKLVDRVEIKTPPGSYRIDLHPEHFPPQWRGAIASETGSIGTSVRVNVALGSYTNLPIPLTPIYTVRGTVFNAAGKPLPNVEVVAEHLSVAGNRRQTTTKADGSYEFVDLPVGAYQVSIPGQSSPSTIAIVSNSPVLQQLNLYQTKAANDLLISPQSTLDFDWQMVTIGL